MNCQSVGEDGIAEKYLKGELEPPVQDEFEVHILECPRCLQSVETLQEMRTALAAQAHEIRLASQRPSFRLRYWAFAAVALVVFVGIGVLQLRKRKPAGAEVSIVQQAPPSRDPVAETTQQEAVKARDNPLSSGSSGSSAPQPQKSLPSARHNPTSGKDTTTELASGAASAEPPAMPIQEPSQVPPAAQISASNQPAVPREVRKQQPELTSEQALELYRLGEIHPAPYSFSGLAASAKYPARRAGAAGAVPGGVPADPQRTSFRNAMVAYVDGRYADASTMLENAASFEPKAADVNFYRGVCRLLLGHSDDAIPVLTKVIEEGKSPLVQPAHVYLARAYLQKANLKQAEAELATASVLPGPLKSEANSMLRRVRSLRASLEAASQTSPPQ
jgi:hypothetical protein